MRSQQRVGEAPLTTLAGGTWGLFLFDILRQLIAKGVDLGVELSLVEQDALVRGLLAAGRERLDRFQAQQFFEEEDVIVARLEAFVALLELNLFGRQLLLKACNNGRHFSGRETTESGG